MNKNDTKTTLSVVIITKDEEENITKSINSVRDLADEIVIVDCGSTDATVPLAKKLGAKVFHRDFDNFSSQKNYAASCANSDWILALDADETITLELASEIKIAIRSKNTNAYLIPRKNIILGAEIKHTRWSPDKHVWLWRKGKGKWVGEIHEEVKVDGLVGELKNAKIHRHYPSVKDFLEMVNDYSNRESSEIFKKARNQSPAFMLFFAPLKSFFGRFFYKKGFLDGWRGFVLSYLMAFYQFTTWVKVWEKQENKLTKANSVT